MQALAIVQTSLSQLDTQVFVWQQETNNNVDFMAQTMNNRVHQKQSNKYMYVCIRFELWVWVVCCVYVCMGHFVCFTLNSTIKQILIPPFYPLHPPTLSSTSICAGPGMETATKCYVCTSKNILC